MFVWNKEAVVGELIGDSYSSCHRLWEAANKLPVNGLNALNVVTVQMYDGKIECWMIIHALTKSHIGDRQCTMIRKCNSLHYIIVYRYHRKQESAV